jgi:hypothetical protein
MKTDDLVSALARSAPKIDRRRLAIRWIAALAFGMLASIAIMAFAFGVNPDLAMMFENVWFWVRFTFIFCVGALAAVLFCSSWTPRDGARYGRWMGSAAVRGACCGCGSDARDFTGR